MESPVEVVAQWQDAWNRGDADALAELFAVDAEFVNVVGIWWHDRERIRKAHAFGLATIFPGSVMEMGRSRVRLVGADAAVVQARWHLTGQSSPAGDPVDDRAGVFTFVLERRPEGWITVAAQNTDAVPDAQTHINAGGRQTGAHYGPVT